MPCFERAGFDVTVHPLLDDAYLRAIYALRRAPFSVLRGYAGRFATLLRAQKFDAIFIEKEALPWLPMTADLFMFPRRIPIIVDYDDAVFHNYDRHDSAIVRALLGSKIDKIMGAADLVTVGNSYLGDRARAAGCTNVQWVPTVIDLERYPILPRPRREDGPTVIGWIGSPSTASYLRQVAPALERVAARHAIRCVAIGARPDQVEGTPFEPHVWSEESEVHSLRRFDIGIMPLPDAPWERGKCGYKLIQFMACGLPVVASPVGVNREIVEHGVNGILAESSDEWDQSLMSLVEDAELRRNLGANGRRRVEERYCIQVQGPRLVDMIEKVVQA